MENFNSLNLEKTLMDAIAVINFKTPTPIQAQAIPIALEGKDQEISLLKDRLHAAEHLHPTSVSIPSPTATKKEKIKIMMQLNIRVFLKK